MADFNYFDQYQDMEINLTDYLLRYSTKKYQYNFSNIQPVKTTVKNIFTYYDVIIDFKKNIDMIFNYQIVESETPELVSNRFYSTVDHWWLILVFNDITNPWTQWPMSQEQINTVSQSLYDAEKKYSYQTYYNFIFADNEEKRKIIVPRASALGDIFWAYRQKIIEDTI